MMRLTFIACAAATLLASLSQAEACVNVAPLSPGVVAYDPTSPFPYKEKLKIAIRATPGCGQGADARIGVIGLGFGVRQSQSLQFQILGASGNLLSPAAGAAPLQSFDLGDAESAVLEFDLKIERGQRLTSSALEFDIAYNAASECSGAPCAGGQLNDIVPVSLAIDPVKVFSLSVGGASRGSVDFGAIETGATRTVNLSVTATAPYQVVFDSDNDQNLLLDGGSVSRAEDKIAYTMTMNNRTVTETQPYLDAGAFGTGGLVLDSEVAFTVGDATAKRAGKYRDIVTITIQPLMSAALGPEG